MKFSHSQDTGAMSAEREEEEEKKEAAEAAKAEEEEEEVKDKGKKCVEINPMAAVFSFTCV